MSVDELSHNFDWRFAAYKELLGCVNQFFSSFLGGYCCNCQSVIERLPEAEAESFTLLSGVYPGCCHRGAGDIFRLEGQSLEFSHLAPGIISKLQQERKLLLEKSDIGASGGSYTLRRHRDNSELTGAHCQYFSARGCILGLLKGPLCINFICPPLRCDLLFVCDGDEKLVGSEQDFLSVYGSLAVISYDVQKNVDKELVALRGRVRNLAECCKQFLAARQVESLYDFFNGEK